MRLLSFIPADWQGATAIVAGSGAGLTPEVARVCAASGHRVIAINDAHRLLPTADILYACDSDWWYEYDGVLDFPGQRWSSHEAGPTSKNDKLKCGERWDLTLCMGRRGKGFSTNPAYIHYGQNSGFQGINIALLLGATKILLVGFNMQGTHFFGRHPTKLRNSDPRVFVQNFVQAAHTDYAPKGVSIINCTPGSALKCYPIQAIEEAVK